MNIFNYALFAAISTGLNLLIQWPVFILFEGWWVLYVSLLLGTLVGLVSKYILDKKFIFFYQANSKKDDLHKFALYSLMGILTTLIFWGTEIAFYFIFDFKGSHYVGGALGLMIGYIVKYYLDKKYVFKDVR